MQVFSQQLNLLILLLLLVKFYVLTKVGDRDAGLGIVVIAATPVEVSGRRRQRRQIPVVYGGTSNLGDVFVFVVHICQERN